MRRWTFELLDRDDNVLGLLDGVAGGQADLVAQSPLGGSASIIIDDLGQGIDWASQRVRCIFDRGDTSWPVGTYMFASPVAHHSDAGTTFVVDLLSKMNVLAEDGVAAVFSVAAGTPVIAAVVALIESSGESRIAVTESAVTLGSSLTWEAGTSKLTIINDLLTAVGYWSLWCDGSGMFRVEPYKNPADRAVAYEFQHGEASVHAPDWSHTQDMNSVPNRFVAVSQGDGETAPLIGVAKNDNPDSPYSFQGRGRWITATDESVEASSQAVIDALAERRLRDLMSPVSRLEAVHDMLPLQPNDLVAFIPKDGVRRLVTCQRMSMPFNFDAVISAEWRQV